MLIPNTQARAAQSLFSISFSLRKPVYARSVPDMPGIFSLPSSHTATRKEKGGAELC